MKKLLMILSLSIIVFSCEKNQDIGLPVITLIGPLEVFFDVNAAYVEFGYKATDASGRDISDSVICDLSALNMSRSGSYQISYIAVDRLGKKSAAVYRTVHVGIGQSPVITIAGDNPVILALNSEFTPPSATAVSSDGNTDLSESVVVNAEAVDTSVPGTYSVYYTVSDTGGLSTTEILTVYVLESDIPRIVVNGDGTTPENPLIIEQLTFDAGVSDEEKQSKAAEAFRKSLPTIKAYDLEDGDISYRVSVTENEAYTAVLQAIIGGGSPVDPVTMTVSDKDGNMSAVDLYISVIADSTPPVITIADEQAVYEIEIDMWKDQWSAWETDILGKLSVSVSDDGGTTVEVFPKDGTSESDFATTDSGIKCWIEYPNVMNSTDQQEYPNSDLKTTLKYSTGENTNCYYYQTPTNEINTKVVTLKAKDSAGNSAEKNIKVFLKDTTPPEILTTQSVVAFGSTQYSWEVKDNSGYKTSRSANIPSYTHNDTNYGSAGLIAGTFSVSFSDTDYAKNPVSTTGSLKVNAPSTEDLFSAYGNFSGTDSPDNHNEGDAQAFTPGGWMLADAINAPVNSTHIKGLKRYWYENNSAKEITNVTTIGSSFIICGGIRDKKGTARGYLTCGYRLPVSNVVLGLQSPEVERTLFQNVKYQVSYKHRDFDPITNANGLGGDRYLVVQRRSGNGNFNDNGGTEFRIEWSASSPNDTSGETVIAALRDMKTDQQPFIVRNGNITGFSVLYSIKKSGTSYWDGDYGAIIGNIQIKAIDWPKLQSNGSVVSP